MDKLCLRHPYLLVAGSLCFCSALLGWSDQGHRIVALATQEILTDRSKLRVSYLLGKDGKLVDVATEANRVMTERPETEAWHSITIPPGAQGVDLQRDCPLGECVTAKVRECVGIVRLAIRSRSEIVDAFTMLVALAADMHQPLLNGYPPADGMEDAIVQLNGKGMSLFEAWESGLLNSMGSQDEVLELVRQRVNSIGYEELIKGTYRDWTWETHQVATEKIYPTVSAEGKTVLDGDTYNAASEIVVDQLAKSAIRLAHTLTLAWP